MGWAAKSGPPQILERMVLRYFAFIRDITRVSEQTWAEPADDLHTLLLSLSRHYGPAFQRWVLEPDGRLSQMSIILINGRDSRELRGLDTPLKADDIIAIFPPVAGG